MDRNYCVYMHTSPSGKKYIGLTCQNPESRWANGYGYKGNSYFDRAIQKYGWDAFEHTIVAQGLTQQEACRMETELITQYNTIDRDKGYNMTLGGLGCVGYHHTENAKTKLRDRFTGEKNPFYGKTHSDTTIQKLSEKAKCRPSSMRGKHHSEESKQKLREKRLAGDYSGAKHPLYGKRGSQNPKAKKVLQLDIDTGEVLQVWGCAVDIRSELGFCTAPIYNCCNGKINKAYGYKWQYATI